MQVAAALLQDTILWTLSTSAVAWYDAMGCSAVAGRLSGNDSMWINFPKEPLQKKV